MGSTWKGSSAPSAFARCLVIMLGMCWPRAARGQADAADAGSTALLDAAVEDAAAFDASSPARDDGAPDAECADSESPAEAGLREAANQDAGSSSSPALAAHAEAAIDAPPAAAPITAGTAASIAQADANAPAPAEPAPAPAEPLQVSIRGQRTAREQLQRSSDAVTVVNLRQAKKRSADLGEVLARVAGVSVRRFGGLGSDFRFSLNGLYDTQIRVFVDGVPISQVYAVGLANVPVNLVQDVEIYRGVVPLRLGADALGGAVNLVTAPKYETALQASYQIGSFNTQRATLAGRYRHEPSGFVSGIDAFFDHADNDYEIDVETPDERGRLSPARVRRFHDAYQAYGAAVEIGVVEKPWARRLLARAFTSSYEKELQSNIVMTVPYGEAHYGESIAGGLLTYKNSFSRRYALDVIASYTHRTIDFVDKSVWVYDWHGERVNERRIPGEIEPKPHDQSIWQHGAFGRAIFEARIRPGHMLSLTSSPEFATRTGDEAIQAHPDARDPLTAERELFKLVSGVSYTLHVAPLKRAPAAAEERRPEHYGVENILFAKSYVYRVDSEDPLPGNVFRKRHEAKNRFGAGDTLRVTLADDYLLTKISYEYATRLPDTDEVFGNGVLIFANPGLNPEYGHNANLGPQLDLRHTRFGDFWVETNLFFRDSRDLIVLLGNDRFLTYQNVYRARSMGVENSVKWTSPGRYATLDGQLTYMEQRNASGQGTFGDFKGDRIPSRPWLSSSWGGLLHFERVLLRKDRLEPFYQGRFVGGFFRGWASVGLRETKQTVPVQVSHTVGLSYGVDVARGSLYGTFEIQNLTDAALYDSYGAQRPGRGYYFKLVGEL